MILPFWFKQRQCKAEQAGSDHVVKVSGPNLGEHHLRVAQGEKSLWSAALLASPDGPAVVETGPEFATAKEAWDVAFELYRTHVIL